MLDEAGLVQDFWARMASNDFTTLAPLLAEDFLLEWPQSNERIRGPANFVQMNIEYPAAGRWRFSINRVVGGNGQAVSDVTVTDGAQLARAISFFTIDGGRITRMVEFWPEPYDAPANRRHLVEPITARV